MKATQFSTNTYGHMSVSDVRPSTYMRGAHTAIFDKAQAYTGFLGFGVAITGSSCYNLSKMDKKSRRALLESIYGKDGLGLSVARLSVASSDYSAELYSYDDVPGDTALEHFSIERDEEYVIPMIKEILEIAPDLKLFSSPWSPPGWMKTYNSMCGGYMRAEYIDCYADYYVKFLKEYEKRGIKIFALTPQNEPETDQSGCMPACIWHPDIESRFVLTLKQKLIENGMDTKIWFYDHCFSGNERVDWCLDTYPDLVSACDGIAFHYYNGAIENTVFLREKYPSLSLHFTEGGPRLYDNYDTDWCKWSIMMSKALNCGYSSFTGWNLMLDETGGPNIGPFFCGGLVTRKRESGELSYSGQYLAFEHFAKYISPDSTIYPLSFTNNTPVMHTYPNAAKPVCGTLVKTGDGKYAAMLINPNTEKAQVQIELGGNWWYIELMPDTAATVVFE